MDAELVSLASSGATTLVGLMVSDGWEQVKGRVAALLGRGTPAGAPEAELEGAREALLAARESDDASLAEDVEVTLRTRLRGALRADPAFADELRALLDELTPRTAGGGTVHNVISGGVQLGPVIQGRDFSGLTFNDRGPNG